MSQLNDKTLHILGTSNREPIIKPFVASQKKEGIISYGLSSYGYDIRLGTEFKVVKYTRQETIDPKEHKEDLWQPFSSSERVKLASNSFILGQSLEYIKVPRNCIAICIGKSTYARCGILINVTPLEPEWEGYITMEIANLSVANTWIYPNEGIAQLIFLENPEGCRTSYNDKKGKYQRQTGIINAKV